MGYLCSKIQIEIFNYVIIFNYVKFNMPDLQKNGLFFCSKPKNILPLK
jgi:hypothetical protein